MALTNPIPQAREPIIDQSGGVTRTWWRYLQGVGTAAGTAGPTGASGATGPSGAIGPIGPSGPSGSSGGAAASTAGLIMAIASFGP
jgi:hypothetical protein